VCEMSVISRLYNAIVWNIFFLILTIFVVSWQHVYRLLSAGTMEEAIYRRVIFKQSLSLQVRKQRRRVLVLAHQVAHRCRPRAQGWVVGLVNWLVVVCRS
jgi:hypothetical protein